jgi:hypothetical protein
MMIMMMMMIMILVMMMMLITIMIKNHPKVASLGSSESGGRTLSSCPGGVYNNRVNFIFIYINIYYSNYYSIFTKSYTYLFTITNLI